MKAIRLLLLTLTTAVLSLQAFAQPEKTDIRIAVGGKAALYYLPLTLAEQLGYFRDEGLDVEILDFAGGAKSLQAMMGGSVDVVSGGYDHTIVIQARGQKITAFVLQGATPAISLGIAKSRAAKWRGPQDLKGMKIGVTSPGSSTHMFLNALLAQGNLSADDVSVIGVGTGPSAVAAMRAGHLDAIANIEPAISLLEREGSIETVVETVSEKGAKALFGAALPSGCLYTKQSFIQDNPKTVQALTNAMLRALHWLAAASPEDIARTVPPHYLLGDRALYLRAFGKQRASYSATGRVPPESAAQMLRVLQSFEPTVQASPGIQLADTYTNRFVDAVPAR